MTEYSGSKKAIYNETKSYISDSQNNDDVIDLKDLWLGINRKKKWLFLTAGSIFLGSVIFSFYLRIFKPVFRGNFTILINDPMTPSEKPNNNFDNGGLLFERIAMSSTNNYDVNLVIQDETDMMNLLEFLIVSLESIDGKRGTALPKIESFKEYD